MDNKREGMCFLNINAYENVLANSFINAVKTTKTKYEPEHQYNLGSLGAVTSLNRDQNF